MLQCLPSKKIELTENQRKHQVASELSKIYQYLEINVFGSDSTCFCPFKGGGDIQVFPKEAPQLL